MNEHMLSQSISVDGKRWGFFCVVGIIIRSDIGGHFAFGLEPLIDPFSQSRDKGSDAPILFNLSDRSFSRLTHAFIVGQRTERMPSNFANLLNNPRLEFKVFWHSRDDENGNVLTGFHANVYEIIWIRVERFSVIAHCGCGVCNGVGFQRKEPNIQAQGGRVGGWASGGLILPSSYTSRSAQASLSSPWLILPFGKPHEALP